MTTPKKQRRPMGETLGGVIFGFDQQVFRSTKPTAELIESAKPLAPIPAAGGGTLTIDLPPIGPPDDEADHGADEPAPDDHRARP